MRRRILVAAVAAATFAVTAPAVASHRHHHHRFAHRTAQGGNNNKGDVFVDTVGVPGGPGHEMDPHLPCANINLWGDKLADPSGTYTIDGWPPSGSMKTVYGPTTWNYTGPGIQIISVINVQTLINNAVANGDVAQPQQGFHFKLQFSQDPQKHKTFWVRCAGAGTNGGPPPPLPGGGGGGGVGGGGTQQAPSTTSPTSPGVTVQAPSTAPKKQAAKKKHKKSKVLAKRLRHRRGFTG